MRSRHKFVFNQLVPTYTFHKCSTNNSPQTYILQPNEYFGILLNSFSYSVTAQTLPITRFADFSALRLHPFRERWTLNFDSYLSTFGQ